MSNLFVSSDLPAYVRKNSENVFKRKTFDDVDYNF